MKRVTVPSYSNVGAFPVPIDPRIRRRRIEVRRHEGRRRLRLLLAVMGVVLVSTAGWLASRSPLLDVDVVKVQGSTRTPAEAVRKAAGLERGQAMVDVDDAEAARRLEALPWVADARLERHWPGAVSITVTERTALATAVDEAGTWWLLDRSGRVLEAVGSRPPGLVAVAGLPALPGPGRVVAGAEAALAVTAALSPQLAAEVDAVAMGEGGAGAGIDLKLNPSGIVRLGPPSDLDRKLAAAETVLAQLDLGGLEILDVRLPASPVLTRG